MLVILEKEILLYTVNFFHNNAFVRQLNYPLFYVLPFKKGSVGVEKKIELCTPLYNMTVFHTLTFSNSHAGANFIVLLLQIKKSSKKEKVPITKTFNFFCDYKDL